MNFGKHSREDAEESARTLGRRRASLHQESPTSAGASNEEEWEDATGSEEDDGVLVEEGLGRFDVEEIIEDGDEEEEEEDEEEEGEKTSPQKDGSKKASDLKKKMKHISFEEENGNNDTGTASIWRSDRSGMEDEAQGPLVYSNKAYDSFFQLRTEYPLLSFSILKDMDGSNRTRYPFSMLLVGGSQADAADKNHLALLRIHNIHRTKHDVLSDEDEESEDSFIGGDPEEELHEERTGEHGSDNETEEEINNGEPLLEHRLIPHYGSANRVRISPSAKFGESQFVAVWSDAGHVQVFNIDYDARALVDFTNWSKEEALLWKNKTPQGHSSHSSPNSSVAKKNEGGRRAEKPSPSALCFCTPSNTHRTEGYGLAWSSLQPNVFASGDCDGTLYVWQPTDDGKWKHASSSAPAQEGKEAMSIEEIAWSPTQSNVLLTARAGGVVEVWDTRDMGRGAKRSWQADTSDINVADWNPSKQASHLVVTGAESGAVAIWDLRHLGGSTAGSVGHSSPAPIQDLVWHKKRISSVEFSLHNESVLAVTSDDGQCTLWDLSLERDPSEEQELVGELFGRPDLEGIPDPLMFQHQGLIAPKEVHWHSQIPGMLVTTDYNGLHLFKPMNWRSLMK